MLKNEYRVVQTVINQGENVQLEVCLVTYEETSYNVHTSKEIISWKPLPNIFKGINSVKDAIDNSESEYKKAMEAFNKPILYYRPETLEGI